MTETPPGDEPQVEIVERLVLHKYEGDLSEEEMETAQPLETVIIEDGEIVEHIIHSEEGGP